MKTGSLLSNEKLIPWVWTIGLAVLWEGVAFFLAEIAQDQMAGMRLPYLHDILITLFQNAGFLAGASATTLSRAILGFAAGAAAGFLLAIAMSLYSRLEKALYPYLLLSQMIPILGLAPVVVSIVRKAQIGPYTIAASDITRVIIAGYITFFPVATNMLSGLKSVDRDKRNLMYSYAAGKPTVYAKLMIPFCVPYLFTGMKIAAPLAITASILVDSLGAAEGIGYNLTYALYTGAYPVFWASVLCSAALGIAGYSVAAFFERICLPWKTAVQKKEAGV